MYTQPRYDYLRRSVLSRPAQPRPEIVKPVDHAGRIKQSLKVLGVTKYGLLKIASRYLPKIIHTDEHIHAVAYGRNAQGSVMLVATDSRIIFLDKKPLFVKFDELTYDVVSGVSYGRVSFSTTIKLKTRMGDYDIHTMNMKCAEHFVDYIETRCLGSMNHRLLDGIDKLLQ